MTRSHRARIARSAALPAPSNPRAELGGRRLRERLIAGSLLLGLCIVAGLSSGGAPAHAAFPGQNGRIACDGLSGTAPAPPAGSTLPDPRSEIYTINPDGTDLRLVTNDTRNDIEPTFSADGRRIAFQSRESASGAFADLFAVNSDGTGRVQLTRGEGNDERPTWSPDGARIAFQGSRTPDFNIFTVTTDGSNIVARLTTFPGGDFSPAWSPDGARIAFDSNNQTPSGFPTTPGRFDDPNSEIYSMSAQAGDADVRKLTNTDPPVRNWNSNWSPDGRRIVFQSTRDGLAATRPADNFEIYTMNADGTDVRRLTTNADNPAATSINESTDESPAWSPDGTKIVFNSARSGDMEVYTMNADGSGVTRITNNPGFDGRCDWQPIRGVAPLAANVCPTPRVGTEGSDTINGTPGGDRLFGLGGNDILNGVQGDDCLFGGEGNDSLQGSEHNDLLQGDAGNDNLKGGALHDRLSGGAGRDRVIGEAGNDRLSGGAGNDSLDGGRGRNRYSAGSGNDKVNAANGRRETVNCGSGRRDVARADRSDRLRGCERRRVVR